MESMTESRNPNCLLCTNNPEKGKCPHYDKLSFIVEGKCHDFQNKVPKKLHGKWVIPNE